MKLRAMAMPAGMSTPHPSTMSHAWHCHSSGLAPATATSPLLAAPPLPASVPARRLMVVEP